MNSYYFILGFVENVIVLDFCLLVFLGFFVCVFGASAYEEIRGECLIELVYGEGFISATNAEPLLCSLDRKQFIMVIKIDGMDECIILDKENVIPVSENK